MVLKKVIPHKIILLCAVLGVFLSAPSFAEDRGLLLDKTDEKWSIKEKGEFEFDDQDRWKNSIELTRKITNRFEITLVGKTSKPEGESLEYSASAVEGAYLLTDDNYWLESDIEAGYEINHLGGADEVETKLKLEKSLGQWDHKFETSFSHEVGEKRESGLSAGVELETYYNFENYSLGGVYEASFGRLKDNNGYEEQEHYAGPLISFDLPIGDYVIETELGYLAGLSQASTDHIVKYEFEYAF